MIKALQLHSDRLRYRFLKSADLDAVHELHSLPETDRYNTLGIPKDKSETREVMSRFMMGDKDGLKNLTFVVELLEDISFVGLIALKMGVPKYKNAEVWFKLHKKHWGRGYATEALKFVINFGFQRLQLHRIEAGCAVGNSASKRVMEKCGLTNEGRKRENLPLKEGWSDGLEFAILDTDKSNHS